MTPFIRPFQLNAIRQEFNKLLRVFYFVGDYRVYEATKREVAANIEAMFHPWTPEQKALFEGIEEVNGQRELNHFLGKLRPFVMPFPYQPSEVRALFPKEKKLSVPNADDLNLEALTYLGWRDVASRQLYLVYRYNGVLFGMKGRYKANTGPRSVCCLCNQAMSESPVGLVVMKTKSAAYKAVGNSMCLDSAICNQQLTSTDGLDAFFERATAD